MSSLTVLPLSLLFLAPLAGDDEASWSQWRGPNQDGISTETGWSPKGAEEPLWEMELGLGYSSFVGAEGRIYTMGFDKEAKIDLVWCLDAESGEEIWVHSYDAELMDQFHEGGTLTTPTLDGDTLYTFNRQGNLYSLDAETGDVNWHRDLKKEYALESPTWGFSGSPLILGDEMLINGGPILSLNKKSGKLNWKSKDYGHAYSTPREFGFGGKSMLAVFNGKGIAVLDRADGKEHGFQTWTTEYDVNAATPILVGGDKLFITSGYNHGCALLKVTASGLETVWENREMRTQMAGGVLIDGHVYGFDDAVLKCVDLEGKEVWNKRGLGKGALMAADGKLIIQSAKGELLVAPATSEGFEELERTKVLDGGVYWTKPLLLNGRIYCRNNRGQMVCLDHRAKN